MENSAVLKKEYIERIQNDAILFGKVADMLDVKPVTLPRILLANHRKLTRPRVLAVIRKHVGVAQDSDLLTELQTA